MKTFERIMEIIENIDNYWKLMEHITNTKIYNFYYEICYNYYTQQVEIAEYIFQ